MMKNWISNAVIYQINLRALAAREPRNAIEAAREKPDSRSPLAYVAQHLPTIKRLGANVLYFLPPYPIGYEKRKGIGSPYARRNFRAVEPEYGNLNELAELVRRAHATGLKVIFDITPNHTSRDHVWTASHPEYYVKDAHGGIFFDCDWSDTAKLDYTQPALRREMLEVYDFWLSFLGRTPEGEPDGIDGFRLDMAHFINDRGFWNEALPQLRARHTGRELLFLAECYGFQNNLDLFGRGMTAAYDDDFYKVCQYGYAIRDDGSSVIRLADDARHNQDFRDKYEAFQAGGIAGAMERVLLNYVEAAPRFPEPHWVARYTDNHDEGRGVYRFGDGAVRAAMQLAFMAPRTIPFIQTGQELGALNRPSNHARLKPCDKGCRVALEDRTIWREGVEFEGNLFARGQPHRVAWYDFYRDLIRLRLKTQELAAGDFRLFDAGEECPAEERTVIAFERPLGKRVVRCAVNLGPAPRRLRNAAAWSQGQSLYGQLADGALPAFGAVAVRA